MYDITERFQFLWFLSWYFYKTRIFVRVEDFFLSFMLVVSFACSMKRVEKSLLVWPLCSISGNNNTDVLYFQGSQKSPSESLTEILRWPAILLLLFHKTHKNHNKDETFTQHSDRNLKSTSIFYHPKRHKQNQNTPQR